MLYVAQFTAFHEELYAEELDEACDIAESLARGGARLVCVHGPDGTRELASA